jgi:hypothetical protein
MTFVSPSLAPLCNWTVYKDPGHSDHYPCICTYLSNNSTPNVNTIYKRNFKNADWGKYYEETIMAFSTSWEDLNETIFVENLNKAAEASIPYITNTTNTKYNIPWWDAECAEVLENRKLKIKDLINNTG